MMKSSKALFTDAEVEYLKGNRLARLVTSSRNNQLHVVPIAYEFDGNYLYFSGWYLEKSLEFRIIKRNNQVAIVVDDLVTMNPWRPRDIEIRWIAEVQENDDSRYVRITPNHKIIGGL